MAANNPYADAPPSYDQVTGSSTTSKPTSNTLQVPNIPTHHRRSMEDEHRPLPDGWLRQWDQKEQHQFFVDTKANPPRSIWHHPFDDDEYLKSLSSEEREWLQEEERARKQHHHDTDSEGDHKISAAGGIPSQKTGASSNSAFPNDLPARTSVSTANSSTGKESFVEKLKHKTTGMNKEDRAQYKAQREREEQQYYEAHMRFRQCLQRAQITGQPQFFARDKDGKEIYIEPPNMMRPGAYGGGYGYNPYTSGPYANPNARFVRPGYPYQRPYGPGGGGLGLPIAGGLLGGMMLGGLMF